MGSQVMLWSLGRSLVLACLVALWTATGAFAQSGDRTVSGAIGGEQVFGGSAGGGNPPAPPLGAPVSPTLLTPPGNGSILRVVPGSGRLVVVLRSVAGRPLGLRSAGVASGGDDRTVSLASGGETAFGGGVGGSNPPMPPLVAPLSPTLQTTPGNGPILLAVSGPGRRVVVLRSIDGRLLDLRVAEAGEALIAAVSVPAEGALLDVLGTDVVGLPVVPGAVVRIVVP